MAILNFWNFEPWYRHNRLLDSLEIFRIAVNLHILLIPILKIYDDDDDDDNSTS